MRLTELPAHVQETVAATRRQVCDLHAELPANGLVVWTAGNVSARVPGADLFVIKPSGVRYSELTADNMVVCTLDGKKIEDGTPADLTASSDTAAHAYVYRHMPQVGGVVHTHSPYATAFAANHQPIPCVLTMMADEFGGEVPVGPFAIIGDDSIGAGIVATLEGARSPAVLMANHGPFTVGKDATAAVKAAVMVEEVAKTVALAQGLGHPQPIAQEAVDHLFDRYQNVYGQRNDNRCGAQRLRIEKGKQ
ncbi:L-ribulose-5-phosphate 4-epimerase [Trueperella pecoris]|uniref:L-ribulose-5-phosphate 4-epimerase n=1 Tax=Trueperella pecoris TaxID=2733571 RepID=UPI00186BA68B|nr:L-ribulose-5-phosphate 4-epimerase [Trueperella pecoris]